MRPRILLALFRPACRALLDFARPVAALAAENAILRQQLTVLARSAPRPRFQPQDRFVIGLLAPLIPKLNEALLIVSPETVLRWHRNLGQFIWWRRSGRATGRPPVDAALRLTIRRMWRENPLWGENRIAGELAKLGHDVSPRTVAKYRPPLSGRGRGQKWSTFVRNHLDQTWACDWFTIRTRRFQILYVWVLLDLGRRRIVDGAVTTVPTTEFATNRFMGALAGRDAPRFLIHDRDPVFGPEFERRVKNCGTRPLRSPPRSPKANAFCERVNGTLRRDCLDHVIVLGEDHAGRVLREYVRYYHGRPHRGLRMQPPAGKLWLRPKGPAPPGRIAARPVLGGLHHEYMITQ